MALPWATSALIGQQPAAGSVPVVLAPEQVPLPTSSSPPNALAYSYSSSNFAVTAAADAATGGRLWLVNSTSVFVVLLAASINQSIPLSALLTSMSTVPRVTIERMTFTGTPSAAAQPTFESVSADPSSSAVVVLASTGMVVTAGLRWFPAFPPNSGILGIPLTAVTVSEPVGEQRRPPTPVVLSQGEGVVLRQADAGSAGDLRQFNVELYWAEVPTLVEARAIVRAAIAS